MNGADTFLLGLGRTSLQAAVLVVVVLGVQWALRKRLSAPWRCALWLPVVIRLLLPVSIGSAASVFNLLPRWPVPEKSNSAPAVENRAQTRAAASALVAVPPRPIEMQPQPQGGDTPEASHPEPTEIRPVPQPSLTPRLAIVTGFPWSTLLFSIWLGVALGLLVYIAMCYARTARAFARLVPLTDAPVLAALAECRARLNVSQPLTLVETSALHSPALFGVFRPVLVLPQGFRTRFSERELRFIFLHELAHLKRQDLPLSWVIALLQVIHWFNPLLWLGFARWRADRELACDAMALEAAGPGQNTEYGRTILRLLDGYTRPAAAPVLVGILENKSELRRRIRMIGDYAPARRLSVLAVLLLIALGVVGLTDAASKAPAATKQQEIMSTETVLPAESKPAIPLRPVITSGAVLNVKVRDAETGAPIAGAQVLAPNHAAFFRGVESAPRWITGASGEALIALGEIPADPIRQNTWFTMSVKADGYAPRGLSWSVEKGDARASLPSEIAVRLQRGIKVGGTIQDEAGALKPGVKVLVYGSGYSYEGWRVRHQEYPEFWASLDAPPVLTDEKGRWMATDFPPNLEKVVIVATLPDGSTRTFRHAPERGYPTSDEGEPFDLSTLRAGNAVLVLKSGYTVAGTVVDPLGKPVPGALIKEGYGLVNLKIAGEFRTDAEGRFRLENRAARQMILSAYVEGFAITSTVVDAGPTTAPVRLQLDPLRPLPIKVVDGEGEPIAGARIQLVGHKTEGQVLTLFATTGEEGQFIWTNATRRAFTLEASSPAAPGSGRSISQWIRVAPNQADVIFRLRSGMEKELIVRAKARHAKTGLPVTVNSVEFQNADREGFSELAGVNGSDFTLRIPATKFRQGMESGYKLRFEATGYQPLITPWRDFLEGDWEAEFALEPGPKPGGVALLSDGRPAARAQVAALTREHLSLHIYHPDRFQTDWAQVVRTDDRGAFYVNDPGADLAVVLMHSDGFLATTVNQLKGQPRLTLQPWGRVEGVAYSGTNVSPRAQINLTGGPGVMNDWRFFFTTDADSEGRFAFDKVPPGESLLSRYRMRPGGGPINPAYQLPLTVKPGEVVQVRYGGSGRPIIGRVDGEADWEREDQWLILKRPPALPHPRVEDFATTAAFEKARDSYYATERPNQERSARNYFVQFERDGSFRIEDVPAGTYELRIRITEPTQNPQAPAWESSGKELASLTREVVVPEMPGGRSDEPLDLGVLALDWKGARPSSPGVTLQARTVDGQPFDLATLRGKTVVLAFWASWSERSVEGLATLGKLHSELAQDPRIAFWSVSVDDDLAVLRKTIESRGYHWGQAYLDAKDRARITAAFEVDALPAIFLLDSQGRIIGRDLEGEKLTAAVRRALGPR